MTARRRLEGRTWPLAALGYSCDGCRGPLQIVYGLFTNWAGKPVAVEIVAAATQDHQTIPAQLDKLKRRFRLSELVLVADRGMVTRAPLDALAAADGVEWITALKAPQVKRLARTRALRPSCLTSSIVRDWASRSITSHSRRVSRDFTGRRPPMLSGVRRRCSTSRMRHQHHVRAVVERQLDGLAAVLRLGDYDHVGPLQRVLDRPSRERIVVGRRRG